jgi:hypothetical protein
MVSFLNELDHLVGLEAIDDLVALKAVWRRRSDWRIETTRWFKPPPYCAIDVLAFSLGERALARSMIEHAYIAGGELVDPRLIDELTRLPAA